VWSDVVVSDGALSQAVRTLRRALGDDPREPAFFRTISRHGYRFVHAGVVEEADEGPGAAPASPPSAEPPAHETALERLLDAGLDMEDRREAAEALHALGTEETLRLLDRRPGHEAARALLRDSRFDVPGAGPVPLLGQPGGWTAARLLVMLRLRRALRVAGARWGGAALGGAVAGAVAGALGGVALRLAPGSQATAGIIVALAFIGALIGGLGAAGVGAGLAAAETLARSRRGLALVALGAAGGGAIGALAHLLGGVMLEGVFGGHDLSTVGGGPEGLALGAAAGLGYALTTPRPGGGGMATPRGSERALAAIAAGLCCAAAAVALTSLGRHLTAASLNLMARSFRGSQVGLAPLARLLGEPELGPLTRNVLAAYEGFVFGCGVIVGLTRRTPKS